MSCLFNILFLILIAVACAGFFLLGGYESVSLPLYERHYGGKKLASDKIAVVQIDSVLMEGMLAFADKQIDRAAEDNHVKAVVVRINSPGGSITASDHLHHRLILLRDGDSQKNTPGKPVIVSMASIAASGGYYIAMPAKTVYAERSTITGSIGVYASFPNVKELADKIGVRMQFIKRGDVKASGSPFRDMTPEDQELWQEMVDHAYEQFKAVVEEGRPQLRGKLEEVVINEPRKVVMEVPEKKGDKTIEKPKETEFHYVRRRADGGIFTADKAKELGLIDKIGYLEDAIKEIHDQVGLSADYEVITYEKRFSLSELLKESQASQPAMWLDPGLLAEGATPRLWYLESQSELAALLTAAGN